MAGRLRLATTGVQDQWLTGDPQFSHFLMNFKKHTKFAIDYVESQFDGKIDFGQILECRIPNDKGLTIPGPDAKNAGTTGSFVTGRCRWKSSGGIDPKFVCNRQSAHCT